MISTFSYYAGTSTKLNKALTVHGLSHDLFEMKEKQRRQNSSFPLIIERCSRKQGGSLTYANEYNILNIPNKFFSKTILNEEER